MDNGCDGVLRQARLELQNPCAYATDGEDFRQLYSGAQTPTKADISASRRIHQDPYAHLDGDGSYTALPNQRLGLKQPSKPSFSEKTSTKTAANNAEIKHHSINEIERLAINLQKEMYLEIAVTKSKKTDLNPFEFLDPARAINFIGYDYLEHESLGQYLNAGISTEIAGVIDGINKQVLISRQFQPNIKNFTAAHELGHALLHKANGLHRDKPLNGQSSSRERVEYEADKFATYFLMPKKLVTNTFIGIFGASPFALNEETIFALTGNNDESFLSKCNSVRDLSRILASTERYNGCSITSLANLFQVSIGTMAIRLEELSLISV